MMTPAPDRIMVLPEEAETMSSGEHADGEGDVIALHVPEKSRETPNRGVVVDVGVAVRVLGWSDIGGNMKVVHNVARVGDTVYYGKYVGEDIDGHKFIKHEDVIAFDKGEAWNQDEGAEKTRALTANR